MTAPSPHRLTALAEVGTTKTSIRFAERLAGSFKPSFGNLLKLPAHSPGLLQGVLTHSLGLIGHPSGFLHNKLLVAKLISGQVARLVWNNASIQQVIYSATNKSWTVQGRGTRRRA